MEYKYLFGSSMLKLKNPRDKDWITFVNQKPSKIDNKRFTSIPFYTRVLQQFMIGKNMATDAYKALFLYQLSAPFIDDASYPFNFFNILEHKDVWIAHLKNYINLEKTEILATKEETLPKLFYHIIYQYYMIKEEAHWISEVAKSEVEKIHDLEMPSSYFYELRELINNL